MNKPENLPQASPARRHFLQTSGSVGLLGAALALLSRAAPVAAAAPLPENNAARPDGYHETEHIRKYYAKLRQL